MAYIITSEEIKTLKTFYVPVEINIITPHGVPYEQFTIQFKMKKLRADQDTGEILFQEDAGTIVKALSEISQATVLAVETEISAVMESSYGGTAQIGPMPAPVVAAPEGTPAPDGN